MVNSKYVFAMNKGLRC